MTTQSWLPGVCTDETKSLTMVARSNAVLVIVQVAVLPRASVTDVPVVEAPPVHAQVEAW